MESEIMEIAAQLAADCVVLLHASYVVFVIAGQVAILIGWWCHWRWVHNVWFRGLHLAAIGTVVLESWVGITCPLTTLENWLRFHAGQRTYQGGFVGRIVHEWLFFDWDPWVFTMIYTLFGAFTVVTFLLVPIRWRKQVDARSQEFKQQTGADPK